MGFEFSDQYVANALARAEQDKARQILEDTIVTGIRRATDTSFEDALDSLFDAWESGKKQAEVEQWLWIAGITENSALILEHVRDQVSVGAWIEKLSREHKKPVFKSNAQKEANRISQQINLELVRAGVIEAHLEPFLEQLVKLEQGIRKIEELAENHRQLYGRFSKTKVSAEELALKLEDAGVTDSRAIVGGDYVKGELKKLWNTDEWRLLCGTYHCPHRDEKVVTYWFDISVEDWSQDYLELRALRDSLIEQDWHIVGEGWDVNFYEVELECCETNMAEVKQAAHQALGGKIVDPLSGF